VPYYGPDVDYYFDAPEVELVDDTSDLEDEVIRELALKALLAEAVKKGEVGSAKKPEDVVGAFDVQAKLRDMNNLKNFSVSAAQILLRNGQAAIDRAIAVGKQRSLPGESKRNEVFWKLKWHADKLASLMSTPSAVYESGNDLKEWVTRAFIEGNAAEEGSATLDVAWASMMAEIRQNIAAIPAAAATAGKWTLGITLGVVGLAGYAAYKLINSELGHTVVGAATHAYVGGGRR
jgi:hypothetical protein